MQTHVHVGPHLRAHKRTIARVPRKANRKEHPSKAFALGRAKNRSQHRLKGSTCAARAPRTRFEVVIPEWPEYFPRFPSAHYTVPTPARLPPVVPVVVPHKRPPMDRGNTLSNQTPDTAFLCWLMPPKLIITRFPRAKE